MSAAKAGHRFGIVLAAIPALLAAGSFYHGQEAWAFVVAAVVIYLACLGIGWALSAVFD